MLVKSAALLLLGQTEAEDSSRYRLHDIFNLRSSLDQGVVMHAFNLSPWDLDVISTFLSL